MPPPVGPDTLVQAYEAIVPSGSLAVPDKVAEFVGRVTVRLLPAETVGRTFTTGAGFTVTVTFAKAVAPLLSVTVRLKT